ncbi:MAG: acyltransferase [Mesorhizobium sp.]|nr:MAG: acyltransferase [Mesorhizobium sp.]
MVWKKLLQRYKLVDLCRGGAAFSVLIWHYQSFYYPAAGESPAFDGRSAQPLYDLIWPLYEHGAWAVEFFWAISGFVFAATYLTAKTDGWTYFVSRFARLYPLHLVTLVIVAALQIWSWQAVGHYQIYPENDAYHFGLNTLMIQWWGFQSGYSFNAPSWSVSVEVAIYVLFFFSLPLLRSAPLLAASGFVVLAAALAVFKLGGEFSKCATMFYLGTVCFLMVKRSPKQALAAGIALVLLFFASRWTILSSNYQVQLILLFASITLIAGAIDAIFSPRMERFDWIGNSTYGTYALHVPLQIALITGLDVLNINRQHVAASPLFLLAFLAAVFGLAVVVHRHFEIPAQRWLKARLLRRERSPALSM